MNKLHIHQNEWQIFEIPGIKLPPFGVGYMLTENLDNNIPTIVAYCWTPVQARFILDAFNAQATPDDYRQWEIKEEG